MLVAMTSRGGSLGELMAGLPSWVDSSPGARTNRAALVSARVDPRNAQAYRDAVRSTTGRGVAVDAGADLMCTDLLVLATSWPGMSARSGIGWVLAARGDRSLVTAQWVSETVPAVEVDDLVMPWGEAGLFEDGWLYCAAGLSPAEASVQAAAGTVDRDALRVLAALRGVPVPVAA
jgi:hypothetical protein